MGHLLEKCEELARNWMPGFRHAPAGVEAARAAWKHPEDLVHVLEEWPHGFGEVQHEHMAAVAWLHDILEDGVIGERDVGTRDLMHAGIPPLVVHDVVYLSCVKGEPATAYLERLAANGSYAARAVKCVDRICNLEEGHAVFSDERWARFIRETEDYIVPLAEGVHPWLVARLRAAMAVRAVAA